MENVAINVVEKTPGQHIQYKVNGNKKSEAKRS